MILFYGKKVFIQSNFKSLYCFRFCEIIKNQIFLEINLNFGFIIIIKEVNFHLQKK